MKAAAAVHPPRLEARGLAALPGVRHGFFGREGGVSTGVLASLNAGFGAEDDPAAVAENRRRIANALGLDDPARLLSAYQVHSDRALVVEAPFPGERPRVDALATPAPGLAVGVVTADCAPILLADAEARVVGAAHAGWRGALGGVVESAIARMCEIGARAERIAAAVGPCISQVHYEVGPEFVARFVEDDPSSEDFFAPARDDRAQFDLKGYLARRLAAAGVGRVEVLAPCTYADAGGYFSHRRGLHHGEAEYGRNLSAIVLAANP